VNHTICSEDFHSFCHPTCSNHLSLRNMTDRSGDVDWLRSELERYKEMYEHERSQFEEFQSYSKELEKEMDMELTAGKRKITELDSQAKRLQSQLDETKTRAEKDRRERLSLENDLRAKLAAAEKNQRDLTQRLQKVEQVNDNLEKRERIQAQEIVDLRLAYEKCLERCALLESGLPLNDEEMASASLSASTTDVLMVETPVNGTNTANPNSSMMNGEGESPVLSGTSASRNGSSAGSYSGFGSSILSGVRRATNRVFSPHQERTSSAIVNSLFKKIEEVEKQVDPAKYVIHRTPNQKK